ncbi:hypothetical protein ACIBSW_32440 [Actinoplanes sp. NPDC049668]|uniref:hypothetical protein n=1 Tax=unclassified Actinoplanes TaxID=2626549 RepID=UPI0033B2A32F
MVDPRDRASSVNWAELPDIYGDTGEIPSALEAIRSADAPARRAAYKELADRLVSQGTRSAASVVAARLLIDIVADESAPDRFAACQVLAQIAIGDEEYWLTEVADIAAMRAEVARKAALTVDELEQEQAEWVAAAADEQEQRARRRRALFGDVEEDRNQLVIDLAAYDAVRAGVPVYLAALTDPHLAVRLYASHLLAWFPEESAQIIPALTRVIAGDPSPFVAATASVAAGLCAGQPDDALSGALTTRRATENLAERWSAVIGLTRVLARPDRSLIEDLYSCMLEADAPVPNWPFLDGDISTMAALTVARLSPETAPDRVEVLSRRVAGTRRGNDRFTLLGALLDAAFPGGIPRGTPGTALTESQRMAARALVDGEIWRDGAMAKQLLAHFGLPADRRALQAWIA